MSDGNRVMSYGNTKFKHSLNALQPFVFYLCPIKANSKNQNSTTTKTYNLRLSRNNDREKKLGSLITNSK